MLDISWKIKWWPIFNTCHVRFSPQERWKLRFISWSMNTWRKSYRATDRGTWSWPSACLPPPLPKWLPRLSATLTVSFLKNSLPLPLSFVFPCNCLLSWAGVLKVDLGPGGVVCTAWRFFLFSSPFPCPSLSLPLSIACASYVAFGSDLLLSLPFVLALWLTSGISQNLTFGYQTSIVCISGVEF